MAATDMLLLFYVYFTAIFACTAIFHDDFYVTADMPPALPLNLRDI